MWDRFVKLVLDEGKWFAFAMLTSAAVVAIQFRWRRPEISADTPRPLILWAMTLFYASVIAIMGTGHILAVVVKDLEGDLQASRVAMHLLGVGLAVPAWWLVLGVRRFVEDEARWPRTMIGLHAWLALFLVALGPHNLPIAAPALLNIGYQLHSRPRVGWAIVGIAATMQLALLCGAVVFALSGQTFEEFGGA